jgi:hypothetical protein
MEQCQSLKALKLEKVFLDEDHFRVLGDLSKPGLEIKLKHCQITGAASVLAEVLGRNQGPTELDWCSIDTIVVADGLRGNSRLKSLTLRISSSRDVGKREVLAFVDALRANKGLAELNFSTGCFRENDETWNAVCDSLKTHPTLEVLQLRASIRLGGALVAPAVIKSRIQALVDMLKVNMSIQTTSIECYSEHELFRGSVIPYLETNRLRPRVRAIQKTCPLSYRAKVLGRALLATRTDVNSFWMMLSGNAEIAFSSTSATTTPASSTTGAWCFCCW